MPIKGKNLDRVLIHQKKPYYSNKEPPRIAAGAANAWVNKTIVTLDCYLSPKRHKSMLKTAYCGGSTHGRIPHITKTCLSVRQVLLVMRLTVLLLTVACLQVAASGKAQNISFSGRNVPLEKLIKEVQRQTGYVFLFEGKLLHGTTPVTIQAKGIPLTEFLEKVFENQPIKYMLVSKSIVLFGKLPMNASASDQADNAVDVLLPVRIRVVDAEGNPLPGASVTSNKNDNTVVTDAAGVLTLEVNKGDVLEISFVGFEKQLYTVTSNSTTITIVLKQANRKLDEVVVNKGYYSEKRRLSTGNVSRVSSEEIERQPVSNVLAALAGRVPGMLVTQGNGLPGSSFKVEVRGRTAIDRSLTDDQPLFIIDGIPVAANNSYLNILRSGLGDPAGIFAAPGGVSPFASLNTADIESIEVLKDGDATAIYGSRGANGVVLITTKRGRKGKTSLSVSAYTGYSEVTKPIETLSTQQYVALRRTAFLNDNVAPTMFNAFDILAWDTTRYTNFNKLLGRNTAHTNDVNVSLSGGSEGTSYIIGGAYHRETTVLPGNLGTKRGTMHFSVNHESPDRKLNVLLTGSYNAAENNVPNFDFAKYYNLPPNLKLYEANGALAFNEGGVNTQGPLTNPMAYFK
jgi:TonB-dependent starch-binding outer membrane protein SusC